MTRLQHTDAASHRYLALTRDIIVAWLCAALVTIAALSSVVLAQTPTTLSFEEASVKPASGDGRTSTAWSPREISVKNSSLRSMIQMAYQVRDFQIKGGPRWIDSDRYDLIAKPKPSPSERSPTRETAEKFVTESTLLLQNFLVAKFKLKVHRETDELPVYALTVANGGARMRRIVELCTSFEWHRNDPPPNQTSLDQCGAVLTGPNERLNHTLDAIGMVIAPVRGSEAVFTAFPRDLISFLSQWGGLDHLVIDRTGLKGSFDIHLEWSRQATPDSSSWDNPSIFTAVEEQLGLKLELANGPVEVLAIDNVERLSQN